MVPPANADVLHFGVAAQEIWKARVLKEKLIASNWAEKWDWMLKEYNGMSQQLENLKQLRSSSYERSKSVDSRSCKPLPDTSSRVIGWLANRPDFQLEMYGPYIKKIPLYPPMTD